MGATTYRLMHGFDAAQTEGVDALGAVPKLVFSTTLTEPLEWENSRLIRGDAVAAVRELKQTSERPMATLGSLSLARSLLAGPSLRAPAAPDNPTTPRGNTMTATYTWDVFMTLDGFGSHTAQGDWGGYWGKQGPEFLARRAAEYRNPMRLVLGANSFRMFQHYLESLTRESEASDPVNTRMKFLPTTVVSSTLPEQVDRPDATVERSNPVDVVTRLKDESPLPLAAVLGHRIGTACGRAVPLNRQARRGHLRPPPWHSPSWWCRSACPPRSVPVLLPARQGGDTPQRGRSRPQRRSRLTAARCSRPSAARHRPR